MRLRSFIFSVFFPCIPCIPWFPLSTLRAEDRRTSTVGMPARIDQIVLPGTELEVKPLEGRRAPVVLRIVSVAPHGTAFRYDLEYYGLEKGTFDLKNELR